MTPTLEQPQLRNASTLASKAKILLASAPIEVPKTLLPAPAPAPSSVIEPVELLDNTEEQASPMPAILPTSQPTIKTTQDSSAMNEKSGDTYFPISVLLPGGNSPSDTTGSQLTPEETTRRMIIGGVILLSALVLLVWLLNRKTA